MVQFLSNFDQSFSPKEEITDPVGKFRVSEPQALIDTDFEYGPQISKWENLGLTSNRPFAYNSPTRFSGIASISLPTGSRTVTVGLTTISRTLTTNGGTAATPATGYVTYTTSAAHGFSVGQYVTIAGSNIGGFNGTFLIDDLPTATTFVVANTATGTPVFTSGTALANVAPVNGSPITVSDTILKIAEGSFLIESGGGTGSFTYFSSSSNNSSVTDMLEPNKTNIFSAFLYTGAQIGAAPTITYSGRAITVVTTIPHGLSIGNEIALTGVTASTNAPNGSFFVATVLNPTTFIFYADAIPTGSITATSARLYARQQASFLHRPFDGGVIFSANGNSNNQQALRQTRRYFRYQSGKGIQYSSGSIFKPSFQLESLTASGTTVTVQTKEQHNILPGTQISIVGSTEEGYNGDYTVSSVLSYNKFQFQSSTELPPIASGRYYVTVSGWSGSVVRAGLFDEQNGVFFEFDGSTLYAVRRSSTYQLSGRITATNGSATISQTSSEFPTNFSRQLEIGEYVVIRGQSYKVLNINSDTEIVVSPAYRGATASHVTISKTFETKIPQSQWNIDKCDGTGYSGYNVDLNRMQMFYVDYSWYGAGFIRWGLRGPDGNIIYVHKIQNNNVNLEAYMRSGNLPGRYETHTIPPVTKITQSLTSNGTTINVVSTENFPTSGTITLRGPSTTETVNYSGKTGTSFTGVTRAKAGSSAFSLTIASGSNTGTASVAQVSESILQIGQRISSTAFPESTYIQSLETSGSTITIGFSEAATSANPTGVVAAPMSSTGQSFTYSQTAPVAVELAYPSFSPTISHWGTSVIMDGRYDDDKSLIFTYGQTVSTAIPAGESRALLSIRVAPSADNGIGANFGERELINRMQLKVEDLGVSVTSTTANYLVRAYLNGIPSIQRTWTNAVGNIGGAVNSSLAQIAEYPSASNVKIYGGEVTGGFLSQGTNSLDLTKLRDLGNSILGGGTAFSNSGIYPDGPDTLTIVVTNLSASGSANFLGRISWTEAQA